MGMKEIAVGTSLIALAGCSTVPGSIKLSEVGQDGAPTGLVRHPDTGIFYDRATGGPASAGLFASGARCQSGPQRWQRAPAPGLAAIFGSLGTNAYDTNTCFGGYQFQGFNACTALRDAQASNKLSNTFVGAVGGGALGRLLSSGNPALILGAIGGGVAANRFTQPLDDAQAQELYAACRQDTAYVNWVIRGGMNQKVFGTVQNVSPQGVDLRPAPRAQQKPGAGSPVPLQ